MEAYLVQEGSTIDYTPTSAVECGEILDIGGKAAVAQSPIAANALGSVSVDGIFAVACATGVTFALGEKVYWDISGSTAINFGSVDAGDFYLGLCTETKTTALIVYVDLNASLRRGLQYVNVAASSAHTNTTTEALFDKTFTIPANTLRAGDVLRVRYQGIATATNSTDTLTIKLYFGGLTGTAILAGTATDVENNNIFAGDATIVLRTVGSSGTFVAYGVHTDVPAASGTAQNDITEITASTAIDTTAAIVIGVGADWSVANASDSARLDILTVEKL